MKWRGKAGSLSIRCTCIHSCSKYLTLALTCAWGSSNPETIEFPGLWSLNLQILARVWEGQSNIDVVWGEERNLGIHLTLKQPLFNFSVHPTSRDAINPESLEDPGVHTEFVFYLNVSLQFGLSSVPRPIPFVCLLATFQKCGSFGILLILRIFANPLTPGNNFNIVLLGRMRRIEIRCEFCSAVLIQKLQFHVFLIVPPCF
uniref:Uncharacterized protein n=1 Tax=Molossus molossus TaxID=27622 RepID=A0A7J8E2G5_MOLMO|nr:hypothetical protein HJG59_009020 [Molossus molossus]